MECGVENQGTIYGVLNVVLLWDCFFFMESILSLTASGKVQKFKLAKQFVARNGG